MDTHRAGRVSEALREELAEIIGYELADPRVRSIDVTEVVVAPGMRQAVVRVHVCGENEQEQEALKALEGARHYLRRELAARLRLFRIPELHFEADAGPEGNTRLEHLLRRARKGRSVGGETPEEKT